MEWKTWGGEGTDCVALVASDADDGGKTGSCGLSGRKFVEDVAHGAGEDAFDSFDLQRAVNESKSS
jgi:hypothetical protein